jgi:ABC-type polysaccharide/polyol phosphate export permease
VVIVLMLMLVCFATGIGLALAAVNVYFRDVGYLWTIFSQLWFFATPIVYVATTVSKRLPHWGVVLYEGNPMAVFTRSFRKVLYELQWPTFNQFSYMLALSVVSLTGGLWLFNRLSPRFAEEL